MRGSLFVCQIFMIVVGIIPADAGLTFPAPSVQVPVRDHPRGCGAHLLNLDVLALNEGSSPRMRGSRQEHGVSDTERGIIPADAGLTIAVVLDGHHGRDHPRGCGAHQRKQCPTSPNTGSSPRMRGSLIDNAPSLGMCGIIPADAGLTCRQSYQSRHCRDHPRGCGAHL